MKQVLPFEAYRSSIVSMSLFRGGVISALLFAVLFFIGFSALAPATGRPVPWLLLFLTTCMAAVQFGLILPLVARRWLLRTVEAVYHGSGRYATAAPSAAFCYRLPCSLLRGRIEVGGVLYLGDRLATFVPHSANLPTHRQTLTIVNGDDVPVRLHTRERGLLGRLFTKKPEALVEVATSSGTYAFNVPQVSLVLPALQRLLGASRGRPA